MTSKQESIYKLYSEEIYRHLFFLTGQKELAEDLLQNTFIKVLKNIDQLKEESKLRPWIYRIARNQYLDYLKSSYVSKRSDFPSEQEDISKELGQAETVIELKNLLKKLKPQDRELILLVELEGFTVSEASDIMGISASASKSRLNRTREQLLTIKKESI